MTPTASAVPASAGDAASAFAELGRILHDDQPLTPTLQRVAGPGALLLVPKVTGAEDFSFYQQVVPGLFFFVGVTPPGTNPAKAYSNHSPRFSPSHR